MRRDLSTIGTLHPRLRSWHATSYERYAATGLERHGHGPGVHMTTMLDDEQQTVTLDWSAGDQTPEWLLDRHRVTEEAAEGISLTLVGVEYGWVVHRRLQRGGRADWVLFDASGRRVALEISGIDRGACTQRLREKAAQAGAATGVDERAACVVELASPRAELKTGRGATT
jgi:hypothetical protein